ncbi:MAG: HlyD family type I secretion periplasmic adaptor subunit [Pseudomonadota bacterium]
MSAEDLAFANDVRAAADSSNARSAWAFLSLIAALLISFGVWANYAVLDEVTRADGQIIPASRVQIIQSLEGGIVRSISVRQGEIVEANQVLLQIDDTGFASELGELASRKEAALAQIARLKAEANGLAEPAMPDGLAEDAPAAVAAEKDLFLARQAQLQADLAIIASKGDQTTQELAELNAREKSLKASLAILQRELKLSRQLFQNGAIPELELLRLERDATNREGEITVIAATRLRLQATLKEIETRRTSAEAKFRADARAELAKATAQISVINEALSGSQDKVQRTAIRSPVRGIVNTLLVNTVGGVLKGGDPIMEIVPLDDRLQVEARVQPKDVAFIRAGQKASVKLTAYDYTIYGALDGVVDQVSPNTIKEPEGEPYFRVIISTEKTDGLKSGKDLEIIPGMIASVDILTGQKSVLQYLLQPVQKLRSEALRER